MHSIVDWFTDRPDGAEIGTVELAAELGYSRESVFRALVSLEAEGWVERIAEPHGGLGTGHQRRWRCPRDLSGRRGYRESVEEARRLRSQA